jgi:hypothetical protein
MFRIVRLRIRRKDTNQHDSDEVLTTLSVEIVLTKLSLQSVVNSLIRGLLALNPGNWGVRVSWVGFGSNGSAFDTTPAKTQLSETMSVSPPIRVLGTFNMPKRTVRVSWIGLAATNRIRTWAFGFLVVLLGIFAFTRLTPMNHAEQPVEAGPVLPAGLITDEIDLGDQTIQMSHSALDIGQAKDVFDGDIETLMRGLEANPFIIDLQFSQPQVIKGLIMDFGRMDFVMRVKVYGTDGAEPISYQGEYRQQPDIPHLDMDFVNGPKQVKHIYIEIEQLQPPEEVHIHVREIVFKK